MTVLSYYGGLLSGGRSRLAAFRAAIHQAVEPGDRVLDVGTGLGTFSFFAAQAGAGEVWAVERDPVIHVARQLARVNDPRGVVRFIQGSVPGIELPGDFDVVIFEDFPPTLLDRSTHDLLGYLDSHLLASNGRLVPSAARLSLAPARADRGAVLVPFDPGEEAEQGLDFSLLHSMLANEPRRVQVDRAALLGGVAVGDSIPLHPRPASASLRVGRRWRAPDGGTVNALLLWFDLRLAGENWISNAPGADSQPWGQTLLPVDPPLDVEPGGGLRAEAVLGESADGGPGWWRWSVECGDQTRTGHQFAGTVVSPAQLDDLRPGASKDPATLRRVSSLPPGPPPTEGGPP